MKPDPKPDPSKTPPLSAATLHILLALAGGDLHGYGIIQEIKCSSSGSYKLGPGTLYDNLRKLMDTGLVAEAAKTVAAKEDDRRLYTLTRAGKGALNAEVDRMQRVVREARLRLQETRPGKA